MGCNGRACRSSVKRPAVLVLLPQEGAPAEVVREQIKKARELTDKPFGVNVMLMNPNSDEIMQVIMEEKPAVVATGAGNPGKYIEGLKAAGIKIMPVIASVAWRREWKRQALTP